MHIDPSQRYQATTQAEFLKMLDDAIFEVDEYIFCVQEELDDELEDMTTSLGQIKDYLVQLKQETEAGKHAFSNGRDLDYVPLAVKLRHVLPFYALLDGLNRAHHRGVKA